MIRLALVAHAVKTRSSLPDCCCGYTLDQAVALEKRIWEWQDAIPAFLRISEDGESPSTTTLPNALHLVRRLQAYELGIVSNVLVVNVYMPFLRPDGNDGDKSCFKNLAAVSACILAAQAIVHLTTGLQALLSEPSTSPLFSSVKPVMLEFIPLETLLFGAVVVSAHAALAVKSSSKKFGIVTMADNAFLGLKTLQKLGPPFFSSVVDREGDNEFQNKVMSILHVRLVQRSARLKPKLDDPASGAGAYYLSNSAIQALLTSTICRS